ncbi:hypothetical protein NicSoilB4_21630 [Arthrobacter sp. NicSoilB4]|nr:hypothetical protein NicSoilB4_21630 [Arthrobacter sp. NicSoilB4]
MSHRTALARARFGALALALMMTAAVGCSSPASFGARTEASSGAAADVTPGASLDPAAVDSATSDTKTRVEAALDTLAGTGRTPGTEEIRSVLIAAGFASDGVEVTASRTPTGLEADAVVAAVASGSNCIVAQLRGGNVSSAVLPVLADGRCLVGTAG